jgi:threonyl-tRNA synthetase
MEPPSTTRTQAHFKRLEEIKARDHRVLSASSSISTHPGGAGSGLIFWHL